MPGAKPYEAVTRFLDTLTRALSCVEDTKITVSPRGKSAVGEVHALRADPITLPRPAGEPLRLELALQYEIIHRPEQARGERYKVRTRRYQYHLFTAAGAELVLFHWHPEPDKLRPHTHAAGLSPLTKRMHIPSGRVTVESILRFALTDLAVRPNRGDWPDVLDDCEADFERFRTWA